MSSSSFEAPSLEALAKLLPAYEFEAFIAQGGMGAVYKARQRSLDRDVAIKILPRELGEDPDFKASFETEARAMARLNHPNLVGVYDSGEVDGMLYIVMELVNGKPLYYSAYNTAIDPAQAAEIVKGICDGLAHAHENGVIHRDIKPANILLTPKREPKIGDFGLAQPVESDGPGLVMGTPGYAAPELTDAPESAGMRSDIFAVGVILYELLTGHRPEEGSQPPSAEVGCDRDLDVICHHATHPDPARRYADAGQMSKALEEWLKKPVPAGPRKLVAAAPRTPVRRPVSAPATPIKVKGVRKPVTPRPAPTPGVSTPPVQVGAGGNWTLVRNMVIIAGLLLAIAVTWKHYQRTKGDREDANRIAREQQAEREAKARALANRKPDPVVASGNPTSNPTPEPVKPEPVEPPKPETSAESLERLKSPLAAGERDEMPVGSVRRGSTENLLVSTPMTWQEASNFADAHGGHLPLVTADEDISWLTSLVPAEPAKGNDDSALWIGAGRSGRSSWTSVDGSLWKLKTPVGAGQFLAVDDVGLVRVRKPEVRYPFIIQWQRDGSNPASLEAVLKRTRESLDQPIPAFPPGTLAYEARHVLVVLREVTADEAQALAEMAGGHLAVPASRDEAGWLADEIAEVSAGDGLWIGGVLDGAVWKWTTGESWTFARWAEGYPDSSGSALLAFPGEGWKDADPEDSASGFIIEWSNDRESAAAAPPVHRNPSSGGDLVTKSKQLLAGLEKKRDAGLAANARILGSNLDTWLRRQNGSETTRWSPEVASVKELITETRVPGKIDADTGIRLSAGMAELCESALAKQKSIDADFIAAATKIRDAYVVRLTARLDDAKSRGQAELVKNIEGQIEDAADVDGWISSLGKEGGGSTAPGRSAVKGDPITGAWIWGNGTHVWFYKGGIIKSAGGPRGEWEQESSKGRRRTYKVVWRDNGSTWSESLTLDGKAGTLENPDGETSANRNMDPTIRELVKELPEGEDPVTGVWQWQSRQVILAEDGNILESDGEESGSWKLVSEKGSTRRYFFEWAAGVYTDTLGLDDDGMMLEGRNNKGEEVRAIRIVAGG